VPDENTAISLVEVPKPTATHDVVLGQLTLLRSIGLTDPFAISFSDHDHVLVVESPVPTT
jgi:hypothetical protein